MEVIMGYNGEKVNEEDLGGYQKHFDKNVGFRLLKLRKSTRNKPALIAGSAKQIVVSLGHLLSAFENPETPAHLKVLIGGAIGYIILPIDLIPDFTPVLGYSDDLASAAGVVATIIAYSNFSIEKLDKEIDSETN